MNSNGMAELLSKILDTQIETGQYRGINEQRLRQALTTGPGLDHEEQSLLLLSPVIRHDYKRIRHEIKKELTQQLQNQGVEMQLLAFAAASTEDKVVMQNNGFSVTLYRQNDIGIPWIILVQLGPSYIQAINPMTILRLVDSGGLEWLRGKPDANGEITGTWDDTKTDILARSRRFSLALEPA